LGEGFREQIPRREAEGLPFQGKNAKIKITASGSDIAAELERNLSDEWRVFK